MRCGNYNVHVGAHVGKHCFFWKNNGFFWKTMLLFFKQCFFDTSSRMISFDYKVYAFNLNKKLFMFYINFFFITQSLIHVYTSF